MADNWLFLSNDATIGGAITGVTGSEVSLLVAYVTRDSKTFFTETWKDLFRNLVGFEYVEERAKYDVAVQRGGLIYLSDKESVLELLSSYATHGSADAGGGLYINTNAFFYSEESEISYNSANERGGSLCVSNGAQAYFVNVQVIRSESKTSGGGIFVETSGKVYVESSNVSNNFADDSGGGIFLDTGEKNAVTLNDSLVEQNIANGEGCGVFVGREAILSGYKSQFVGNGGMTSSGKSEGGANRTPEDGIYTTHVSCDLPESEVRSFDMDVALLPCQPGFSVNEGVCERCPRDMYSLDGMKCFDCPSGAKCNMTVRRATETIAQELGTISPRTQEGFYLFSAPASKEESSCFKPSQWKNDDPCKKVALETPTKSLSDVIYECSNYNDFNVYWDSERLFSCLSGKAFYTCDVEGACQADISIQTINLASEMASTVSNVSCASGYDLTICSVCATGFKRATDNSCLPCDQANAKVRASIRWQNFVIPVLLILALVGGIYGVRIYLRDLTEIGLLAKAKADRRLKLPNSKKVVGRVDRVKNKLKALFKNYQHRNAKMLFGVDVSPPPRTFPVSPSKFKIFIGFFQIFGNFQSSFVVKWSSGIQNVMDFSQKFNLDLVAIAGIDCVVTKNFYFDFTVTVTLVVFALMIITAYFYAGMRSYRAKLQLIPRNCLRCGLPVLESETIRNDDESFNPFLLLRSWWQTHNFYKNDSLAPNVVEATEVPQNESSVAVSALKETRSLKRKFGMSQVRTPYLGLFRSTHSRCPVKSHVLSGAILDRTVRSNLRVWQARVKLRMNYLTYRNKCLKLYCWMALFLYPSVSKTILTVYNCQEVGDVFYLVADRRLVCYHGQWALFGVVATIGVVVWVVGIPFFFGVLIWLAQDRGVAARLKLLRKPHMRAQLHKWLKEVEEQQVADGRFVRHMDSLEVQDEELAKYMKCKNLTDSTVQARLGFIYAEYSNDYWWFEVVDLSRKLFLSGVIIFVENGSVEQVLLALCVCLMTMWFLLYFQPYDGYSDNLIASITQLQLFFTLWLGVMIRLNDLNTESLINVQLLSFVLVGTCIAVTIFGLSMIVAEGLSESQRIFTETKAQRKKQVQDEVRKCWFKAYNYAAYEAQMVRYGGQLSLSKFSVPAMLEVFRRAKLAGEDPEYAGVMPKMEEESIERSPIGKRQPEYVLENNADDANQHGDAKEEDLPKNDCQAQHADHSAGPDRIEGVDVEDKLPTHRASDYVNDNDVATIPQEPNETR
ncbi:uncharacterized protein KRP23_5823 [Phytophthora ramorum]|uniref:uncharacterized protein n=1 Tax=Phytophthora ramorum TaxID=164328 RepID=UPI0030978BCB|nr:hypothetical protein KRP23_5823 [Phytophthora ramorum]